MNRQPGRVENILVIRPGAMGDILVATPVLLNLRNAFPKSRIAFLVQKRFADVLKANPYIDELIEFDKESVGHFWGIGRLKKELAFLASIRARRFDLALDLLGNLRTAILCVASGARERVGYTYRIRKFFYNRRVVARNPQYVVDFNLDSLRMLGVPIEKKDIYLPADESDKAFAGEWLAGRGLGENRLLVGLFPGGGWSSKRWPEAHFSHLGDMLSSKLNASILVMGGPQEKDSIKRIISLMSAEPVEVQGFSLSRFAGLVSKLHLFISNDSGPRYLAVAAGIPSIGLFGPTNATNANPTESIHSAITYEGDCLGCNKLTCADQTCMKRILPEAVFEESCRLLKEQGRIS